MRNGHRAYVTQKQLDEFEYQKSRYLVPTLQEPDRADTQAAAERPQDALSRAEERKRLQNEIRRRAYVETTKGAGAGVGPSVVHSIDDKNYRTFPRPIAAGPSALTKWSRGLQEFRSHDLVKVLRDQYGFSSMPTMDDIADDDAFLRWLSRQTGVSLLEEMWARHAANNRLMTMLNGTVAFYGFLKEALPDGIYVDKKVSEEVYNLLNGERAVPLAFGTAFTKLLLALVRPTVENAEDVMKCFFSTAIGPIQPSHTVTVADFRALVSGVELFVEDPYTGITVGGEKRATASRVETFKADLMHFSQNQALSHFGLPWGDAKALMEPTTLFHYLSCGYLQKIEARWRTEVGGALRQRMAARTRKPATPDPDALSATVDSMW